MKLATRKDFLGRIMEAGESRDRWRKRLNEAIKVVVLYLIFCLIGAGIEWGYGAFWDIVGVTPWVYPYSWLHYTSLEELPLWGFGGLICVSIYIAVTRKNIKLLFGMVISLVLAALWILFYSNVFQS
jgi:hypothetical protein